MDGSPTVVLNSPWIRVLEEFSGLEQIIRDKVEKLADNQQEFLRPRFRSEDEELRLQESIKKQTEDVCALLKELERMVINGMAPRDPTHSEEVWIAANARKQLSARLRVLMQAFKSGQEYYGNQLKLRERQTQKYLKLDNEESYRFVEQESKAAAFMGLGFTEADIQELLLEEARNEKVSKEIKEILDGVQDLHSMFNDLHLLVVEQGTMLDRIDHNVQQAERDTSKALSELKKAQEHQESGCALM